MTQAAKDTMKDDLAFLSKMAKDNPDIPQDWIWKNYLMHQKVDEMGEYIGKFMPFLMPIFGDLVEPMKQFFENAFKNKPKQYHQIVIEAKEPIKTPEAWEEGDKATLVLEEDIFQAEIYTYFDEEDCYYGIILDDLKDTKSHGAKKGDVVRFQEKHIIKYESKS